MRRIRVNDESEGGKEAEDKHSELLFFPHSVREVPFRLHWISRVFCTKSKWRDDGGIFPLLLRMRVGNHDGKGVMLR